jgi:hypothetical protein
MPIVQAGTGADTRAMKLGGALRVLMVVGGVLPLVGNGCNSSGKASSPDAAADAAPATGGTASGGGSGTGGTAAGGSIGGGGTMMGGSGGSGTNDLGGKGGAVDGGGGKPDAAAAGHGGGGGAGMGGGVDAGSDAVRRFACGGQECVVSVSYCQATRGGTGGGPGSGGGGASGAGGSTSGPPGSCAAFPANCTTRLDCTCLCGSASCSLPTSQCSSTDGNVIYTLFNP